MIIGTHMIVYSRDGEADRAFFKGVLGFDSVDAGHGWLIFALPPSEVAVHPVDGCASQELYLICDDLAAEIGALEEKGVACSPVQEARWGSVAKIKLPGGGEIGLYQPRHPSPVIEVSTRTRKPAPC